MKGRRKLFFVIIFTLACAISCEWGKASNKAAQNLPPESSKTVEAYSKSVEESKKITVARVNGTEISMYQLMNEINTIAPEYIKPGQKRDAATDERLNNEALDRLICGVLAVQEASRQGMKAAPGAISEQIKRLKTALKTEDAFREYLKKNRLTEDELPQQIEKELITSMITEKEIFDMVKVDPMLVRQTYAKDKTAFRGPSGQMSFEEARPLIEQKLMKPAVQKREEEWFESLKKAAKIEITSDKSAKEIHTIK